MQNVKVLFLLIWSMLLCAALSADIVYIVNSESRTLSRIDTETNITDNTFATLGLVPNLLCVDEDNIYVTCSGDNAVQVIDRETGSLVRYISIASSSNPWAVVKQGNILYVTGLMTNKVYRVDLQSNTVTGQQSVGISPEGMAVCGNKLYVANSGGWASGYAGSSVSVLDLESFTVVKTISVSINPQYLTVHGNLVHVSCTGNWSTVSGHVDIIDSALDEVIYTLPLGGNPGAIWIDGTNMAYVGEGMSTGFYLYDANSLNLINSSSNPLTPGGIAITGDQDNFYVLDQNWGSAGRLFRLNRSLQILDEYNLGLVPTDLALYSSPTDLDDDLLATPGVQVFPNPLGRNGTLRVRSEYLGQTHFEIYNLRGQRVLKHEVSKGTAALDLRDAGLASGIYLYRAVSGKGHVETGKLMILP